MRRQQHQFVERWISSIDRKQSLIAVELKFVETTKDPKNQLGVDWSGTFDGGFKFNLTSPSTTVDLNRIKDTLIPTAAILTPDYHNHNGLKVKPPEPSRLRTEPDAFRKPCASSSGSRKRASPASWPA